MSDYVRFALDSELFREQHATSDREKRILELGRKHFAEDFPNPKRRGCPPKNQLKLLAEQPLKTKESVLNHISFCSPCYRDYSHFLQLHKARLSSRV